MMDLYKCGDIKPMIPIHKFRGARIEDAMRFMQKGEHIGKVVVTLPEHPADLPLQPSKKEFRLREDASYLLVGGLGGLGQAIAIWMAEAGARESKSLDFSYLQRDISLMSVLSSIPFAISKRS